MGFYIDTTEITTRTENNAQELNVLCTYRKQSSRPGTSHRCSVSNVNQSIYFRLLE